MMDTTYTAPMVLDPGGKEAPPCERPVRILLIEDEPLYASLVRRKLEMYQGMDFACVWAEYLRDGLARLDESVFDLVLLDLTLPDCSGLKTLARVREATPSTPIVILTGHESDQMAVEALQSGAQDYLVKGSDGHFIVRSIRYAIERFRSQSELIASRRELRSTQMQLLQVEKLDAVGRLAAGIAHEVRNPLATISMGVDYLRSSGRTLADEEEQTLGEMEEAVRDAFTMISGLLDFCLPGELALKRSDLSQTVRDGLTMVRHELEKRKIQTVIKLAENLPPLLLDRRRIQQVILNLVLNAIDAMPDGGRLTITTQTGRVGTEDFGEGLDFPARFKPGQQVVLTEVADTGCGLAASELERVFDPFYTLKEPGQSTGLGLSVTRNIVELHGGHISLRNRERGGLAVSMVFQP